MLRKVSGITSACSAEAGLETARGADTTPLRSIRATLRAVRRNSDVALLCSTRTGLRTFRGAEDTAPI